MISTAFGPASVVGGSSGSITRFGQGLKDPFGRMLYPGDFGYENLANSMGVSPTIAGQQASSAAPSYSPPPSVSVNPNVSGGSSSQLFQDAAAKADPWAPNRGQYQTALNNLMQGGTSAIAADPSFQARIAGGQQALERSAAAKGFLGSGNILQGLQDYGQGKASEEFGNQFQRLSMLAGVNAGSPTAAAGILAQQPGFNLQAQNSAFNQGIQSQKLPYEIQALQQSGQAGDIQNQLLQQQMQQMNEARARSSWLQSYPTGY